MKSIAYISFPINQAIGQSPAASTPPLAIALDTDRFGNYNFSLGWTHVLALERTGSSQDSPIIDDIRDSPPACFNFRSRVNWGVQWERGDWAGQCERLSPMGSQIPWNGRKPSRIAPQIIWNAGLQKKITDKMTIGFAVQNLLDKGRAERRQQQLVSVLLGQLQPDRPRSLCDHELQVQLRHPVVATRGGRPLAALFFCVIGALPQVPS